MKNLNWVFAGILLFVPSLPALAGPNWEVIHEERHDLALRYVMHAAPCRRAPSVHKHHLAKLLSKYAKPKKQTG